MLSPRSEGGADEGRRRLQPWQSERHQPLRPAEPGEDRPQADPAHRRRAEEGRAPGDHARGGQEPRRPPRGVHGRGSSRASALASSSTSPTGCRARRATRTCPASSEMVGIPYVASGPLAHSIALDKVVTKMVLKQHGLPTPDFAVLMSPDFEAPDLEYPLIVKPKNEAVSFGIRVVNDEDELRAAAQVIFDRFDQAVLAERFIEGREFNVGLLGNSPTEALPPVELGFGEGSTVYSYEDKTGRSGRQIELVCPAPIGGGAHRAGAGHRAQGLRGGRLLGLRARRLPPLAGQRALRARDQQPAGHGAARLVRARGRDGRARLSTPWCGGWSRSPARATSARRRRPSSPASRRTPSGARSRSSPSGADRLERRVRDWTRPLAAHRRPGRPQAGRAGAGALARRAGAQAGRGPDRRGQRVHLGVPGGPRRRHPARRAPRRPAAALVPDARLPPRARVAAGRGHRLLERAAGVPGILAARPAARAAVAQAPRRRPRLPRRGRELRAQRVGAARGDGARRSGAGAAPRQWLRLRAHAAPRRAPVPPGRRGRARPARPRAQAARGAGLAGRARRGDLGAEQPRGAALGLGGPTSRPRPSR